MITLFPKAETKPEELPDDPQLARLAFLARHLDDLQTIRLVGISIALMELPLLDHAPHRTQAITMAVTAVLSVAWYYLSRHWFRNRYGRSWNTPVEWDNAGGWSPGIIVGFVIFGLCVVWSDQLMATPAKNHSINIVFFIGISAWLGRMVRDRTNLPLRRTIYRSSGFASVVCFLPILLTAVTTHSRRVQLGSISLYGMILFGVSLFDAWLLHRTFAQIKAQGVETA
jgi:hypothetical protein